MAKKMLNCAVDWCDREITEGTGSKGGKPICPRCRSADYREKNATAKELEQKRERWQYWESRMDYLHPRVAQKISDADKSVKAAKKQAASAAAH